MSDHAWRPALAPLAAAIGLVAGAAAMLWIGEPAPVVAAAPAAAVARTATPPAQAAAVVPAAPAPTDVVLAAAAIPVAAINAAAPAPPAAAPATEVDSDPTPDLRSYVNPGEVPTMADVISRLQLAGITGGLAAFTPPGTRPPLVGLAVPEEYPLPPGYVRHHQSTDDGQDIEPILMYSPDHRFVDANGAPFEVPPDRVVPPELAPPGLPVRRIVIPAPRDSTSRGR